MTKLLSIIVPTYNMEKYLHKCLRSLIVSDKNMKNLEVLVVNDGSTDSSSQIAHEYEAKYPQTFKVIDKGNGNYGSCINRGLKEATGKYVKILDADDSFNTEQFEKYILKLLNTDTDLVLTDFNIVNEIGITTKNISYTLKKNKILNDTEIWNDKSFMNLQMHAVTYKSEIFSKITYFQSEGISYTDQEWIFTPMSMVNSCIYYPFSVYNYLHGRQGQTMNFDIMVRNISHTIQGVYKMCNVYNSIELCLEKQNYFHYRLCKRCEYIYKNYLILHKELNINELITFDYYLKQQVADIYELTNIICLSKYLPFHYIKKWRMGKYSVDNFYFTIIRMIYFISHYKLRNK